jgi:uncharacterized protein YqgC (DUF456 family)
MPTWGETLTTVLVQIFMLAGLIGLLIPIFPGITVMWLADCDFCVDIAAGSGRHAG